MKLDSLRAYCLLCSHSTLSIWNMALHQDISTESVKAQRLEPFIFSKEKNK